MFYSKIFMLVTNCSKTVWKERNLDYKCSNLLDDGTAGEVNEVEDLQLLECSGPFLVVAGQLEPLKES